MFTRKGGKVTPLIVIFNCQLPWLETITGIGPRRAKILKKGNIKDIQTFVKTDNKKLIELLGVLDFMAMKKESGALHKTR